MNYRRLTFSVALTLLAAGCAHLPQQEAAEPDDHALAPPASLGSELEAAYLNELSDELPELVETTEPEPERDLWDRIRDGMQMEAADHPRIEAEIAAYLRNKDYMARVADRAEPYLHYIVEELEKRGMPTELALLPVVESAFRPFAYSSGRAAGIWQFIPSTGRHYGLKQTWWYDGRRDVIASTQAALDYLQRLHGYFSDWELALAAYNSGEGTVMRAVRANKNRGQPTDYWSLNLPRETQAYVPRLLAVRALVADPERYELTLRSIPNEPYLTVVEVGSQIDLALAAELAELPVDDLYRLNPGFNRWATDPEGPHLLVVPIATAERFELALNDLPPQRRVQWERHKIVPGDTLITIANRYHTTVEVLKQVNELNSHHIRAGRHMIVPVAAKSAEHYALSANQRLLRTQQRQRGNHKQVHIVQSGDTLWDLARRYGATTQQLASWNGISPRDTIRPGQNLVIWSQKPNASQSANKAVLTQTPAGFAKPPAQLQQVRYTVRSGDSLYAIASRFGVSVNDLLRWNGLSKQGYLQPGQQLILHVDVTRSSI